MTGDEEKNLPDKVPMSKERLSRVRRRGGRSHYFFLTFLQLFDKKYSTKKTGLELGFHGHPYVAEQFIKAHAALQELAKFVQIIIKVKGSRRIMGTRLGRIKED